MGAPVTITPPTAMGKVNPAAIVAIIAHVKSKVKSDPPTRPEVDAIITAWCDDKVATVLPQFKEMTKRWQDMKAAGPPRGMIPKSFKLQWQALRKEAIAFQESHFAYEMSYLTESVVHYARAQLKEAGDPLGKKDPNCLTKQGNPKDIFCTVRSKERREKYQAGVDAKRTGSRLEYDFAPWLKWASETGKHQLAVSPEEFRYTMATLSVLLRGGRRTCEVLSNEYEWSAVEGDDDMLHISKLSKGDVEDFDVAWLGGESAEGLALIKKIREYKGDMSTADANVCSAVLNEAFRTVEPFREFRGLYMDKGGVDMTVHDFRKVYAACCTAVQDPEWPEDVGNKVLGHKTLAATRVYTTLKCVFEGEGEEDEVVVSDTENIEPPSKKQKMNEPAASGAAESSDESGGTADSRDTIVRTRGPRERREFSGTQCPRLGIDGYCGLCNQIRDKIEANTVIKEKMIKFLADLI